MVLVRSNGVRFGHNSDRGMQNPSTDSTSNSERGSGEEDQGPRYLEKNVDYFVSRVSVFAEDGQNGKPSFSISIEVDDGSNPNNQSRRTERVISLTLAVEEKDLPGIARLAGRKLVIQSTLELTRVQTEVLQSEILRLQELLQEKVSRIRALEEQLQFAIDQLRTST